MTRREQPPVLRKHAMFQTRGTMVGLLAAMAFQANMIAPIPVSASSPAKALPLVICAVPASPSALVQGVECSSWEWTRIGAMCGACWAATLACPVLVGSALGGPPTQAKLVTIVGALASCAGAIASCVGCGDAAMSCGDEARAAEARRRQEETEAEIRRLQQEIDALMQYLRDNPPDGSGGSGHHGSGNNGGGGSSTRGSGSSGNNGGGGGTSGSWWSNGLGGGSGGGGNIPVVIIGPVSMPCDLNPDWTECQQGKNNNGPGNGGGTD